jgi:hypothetical protein
MHHLLRIDGTNAVEVDVFLTMDHNAGERYDVGRNANVVSRLSL